MRVVIYTSEGRLIGNAAAEPWEYNAAVLWQKQFRSGPIHDAEIVPHEQGMTLEAAPVGPAQK